MNGSLVYLEHSLPLPILLDTVFFNTAFEWLTADFSTRSFVEFTSFFEFLKIAPQYEQFLFHFVKVLGCGGKASICQYLIIIWNSKRFEVTQTPALRVRWPPILV
jgi:hypothetical protein